ncbi:MAG: SCO family protein [Alphaproteobacteria bacterium]
MPLARSLLVIAALSLAAIPPAGPAAAHSLDDVQNKLHEQEQYLEIVDRPAPGFTLADPDGKTVNLADLRGKVVVLNFIYASCPDVCPLHSQRIAEIQAMINRTPMRDLVQFVSITTDPVRDTPEILREHGVAHGLDATNWVFLTSGPDRPEETRQLANRYGLKFTETPDGLQMHALVTHLIDREGRLRARYHSLRFEPVNLVTHINALTNDHDHAPDAGSVWQKLRNLF